MSVTTFVHKVPNEHAKSTSLERHFPELLNTYPSGDKSKSQSYFTTDSQSVCLGFEPTLGLATRYYFLSECCCLKFAVLSLCGALSDERTGLQFAVQSLNGPSPAELATIFYCLI
jgi:hypothetical protein